MTTIPNFTDLSWDHADKTAGTVADWQAQVRAQTGRPVEELAWNTPEKILLRPLYSSADLAGLEHLQTMPGLPPFLRGPYSTMYVGRPWTVRQYSGFSTAEESNAFYRRNLQAGQKGLSVADRKSVV